MSLARTENAEATKYFQPFVPDIDNFGGVKIIKNYCLIALKDNGYGLGERSVGVLQLFNKTDGRKIDREDLARVQCLSKFLGALLRDALLVQKGALDSALHGVLRAHQRSCRTAAPLPDHHR